MDILPKSVTCQVILILSVILTVTAFSKYGRNCEDIGCLPSEQCILASHSCSYSQRKGKDCGTYPTCTPKPGGSSQTPGVSLNPAPQNTIIKQSSNQNRKTKNIPKSNRKLYDFSYC